MPLGGHHSLAERCSLRRGAEMLASMLRDSGVVAIFTTEFKRTQETAEATARLLNIAPTIVPANDLPAVVAKLRELKANALVVGHGNTIPDLVKALGISKPIAISENDYSEFLVIMLGDKPQLLRLHYPNDAKPSNGYNIKGESTPRP